MMCSGLTLAGPLNTPAGTVRSTHKALSKVEPRIPIDSTYTPGDADAQFKISFPGSSYATGCATIFSGRASLIIAANAVIGPISIVSRTFATTNPWASISR